ncbi:hypothetical protein Patl1_28800 [Pistacia atlantica]|uniref:Uncharacterized protein n=1 Tax=Pistacia atlantica TaxID=434234 RepID=A0ACC1BD13_9ROSI|nr:hypothetical protein Patl1_28800 [Pistacia atlantica]
MLDLASCVSLSTVHCHQPPSSLQKTASHVHTRGCQNRWHHSSRYAILFT